MAADAPNIRCMNLTDETILRTRRLGRWNVDGFANFWTGHARHRRQSDFPICAQACSGSLPLSTHDKLLLELQIAWSSRMYNAIQSLAFIDAELMRPLHEHQEFPSYSAFCHTFPHVVFSLLLAILHCVCLLLHVG